MTRLSPTLRLNRLVINAGSKSVYDEVFGPGVNVVRGANSTGKSTIANMLFCVLGGEFSRWTPEALRCDYVVAEVLINDAAVTIKREISTETRRPMHVFWGSLKTAMSSGTTQWNFYPYNHTEEKEGLSTVLFRALGFPSVRGELASRVTMHQLLRLLYVDQKTPYDQVFRSETWDNENIRDAVGAILCGLYNPRLYDLEFQLRDHENELEAITTKLGLLTQVLIDADQNVTAAFLDARIDGVRSRRDLARTTLQSRLQSQWDQKDLDEKKRALLDGVKTELVESKRRLTSDRDELASLDFEMTDSELFIRSLKERLSALSDSHVVLESIGGIPATFCPVCYQPLVGASPQSCPLCRQPVQEGDAGAQMLRMKQEIELQLDESHRLQEERRRRSAEIERLLPELTGRVESLQERFDELNAGVDRILDIGVGEGYRELGYLDREIDDLERQLRLARAIEALAERKITLAGSIVRLKTEIAAEEYERSVREDSAMNAIVQHTIELLRQDLEREQAFVDAKSIAFSFQKNNVAVDGRANFSASSMVVLKNAFHLALLIASTKDPSFHYPRFLLLDNIEDKGMEVVRSQNFQRMLIAASDSLDVEHQIIYTTSMVDPLVEERGLGVGPKYTPDRKTLSI